MNTYIVAEIGVNHNGSYETAKKLVTKASDAGVDAVKFQIFNPDLLTQSSTPKAEYQIRNTEKDESQKEMLKKLTLTNSQHIELKRYCNTLNLDYLATPFDHESLHFLITDLQATRIKIASGEITNAPLLLVAAQNSLKIILSTGMATLEEIKTALSVCAYGYLNPESKTVNRLDFDKAYNSSEGYDALKNNLTLLQCTTAYPCPWDNVNLNVMDSLSSAFHLPVGFSDHTLGINISLAAVTKNATLIEKHFTLDKSQSGPDHSASLDPDELKCLVQGIKQIECALGNGIKSPTLIEEKNKVVIRKRIVATDIIKKGDKFTSENISCKRTTEGMEPIYYWDLLNSTANRQYQIGEAIVL